MDERAEIEFVVRDIFDQNLGVSFTNTATYIEESRVQTLGRYVMLKFTYKLKGMGQGLFGF